MGIQHFKIVGSTFNGAEYLDEIYQSINNNNKNSEDNKNHADIDGDISKKENYDNEHIKNDNLLVKYKDLTVIYKDLLDNTEKSPIKLSKVNIDKNFQDVLYGTGYASHLWAKPIQLSGSKANFPPLTPTPKIIKNNKGEFSLPLFDKLRQRMEKQREVAENVHGIYNSPYLQWINIGFPRFPFLFRRQMYQFNSNIIPLPYNDKKYRFVSAIRSYVQDPHRDVDIHRYTEGTCYGDYFPANMISNDLERGELPQKPSDDVYASWFGYSSPDSMPWIPQLPPFPMIPENVESINSFLQY